MIKPKTSKQRLLPIALLPLFSMAVLVGCGSDDDDDGPAVTPDPDPVDPTAVVGDADGNGVPDAFETLEMVLMMPQPLLLVEVLLIPGHLILIPVVNRLIRLNLSTKQAS